MLFSWITFCNYIIKWNLIDQYFNKKTALQIAAEEGNTDIVNLLLSRKEIDINNKSVFIFNHFYYVLNLIYKV